MRPKLLYLKSNFVFKQLQCIGTLIFKGLILKHKNGTLSIIANNFSKEDIYIQSVTFNGDPYTKTWLRHEDIFGREARLVFEMGKDQIK